MTDPFEARMRFTGMLQKLNATVVDAQKAAAYALKFRDYDEDFHSCILEQLERGDINNQINIMYFLEQLCDATRDEPRYDGYVALVQRDIDQIVDLVAPLNPLGKCNMQDTKTVLLTLGGRGYIDRDQASDLCNLLDERMAADVSESDTNNNKYLLSRRVCEQRMEDDRERQKRVKDLQWMVNADEEFDKLWESTGPITEQDIEEVRKQAREREIWLKTMKDLGSEKLNRLTGKD
jgi:CTD kinase subunit gamma CTK3/CTD kinase subunit gamma CTK3 C-terminus